MSENKCIIKSMIQWIKEWVNDEQLNRWMNVCWGVDCIVSEYEELMASWTPCCSFALYQGIIEYNKPHIFKTWDFIKFVRCIHNEKDQDI